MCGLQYAQSATSDLCGVEVLPRCCAQAYFKKKLTIFDDMQAGDDSAACHLARRRAKGSVMDPAAKPLWHRPAALIDVARSPHRSVGLISPPATSSRSTNAVAERSSSLMPTRRLSDAEAEALMHHLRAEAVRVRAVESEMREQEKHVQELLERVREDIASADARVRAAERKAAEIQAAADARIQDAERQTTMAEERARAAEKWLSQISEAIIGEFDLSLIEKMSA